MNEQGGSMKLLYPSVQVGRRDGAGSRWYRKKENTEKGAGSRHGGCGNGDVEGKCIAGGASMICGLHTYADLSCSVDGASEMEGGFLSKIFRSRCGV